MRRIRESSDTLKPNDIRDALIYLNEILYPDQMPEGVFYDAIGRAKIQDIPMNLIAQGFQGDNKRRPKASSRLENPIIVVHGHNRYIIVDGNHRYLQRKNMGAETIKGVILEIPNIWKRTKGGYFYSA